MNNYAYRKRSGAGFEGRNREFVAVDWSGAQAPANKIWLAAADASGLRELEPMRSRQGVIDEIIKRSGENPETIFGLDFAFSFPAWFVQLHRVSTAVEFWSVVAELGERWLAACEAPFWGRKGKRRPALTAHFRTTEQRLPRINGISPKSCFQINGAGAVGTGSIRGIPFLNQMRAAGISVWPFDPPQLPMAVEIYPRSLTGEVAKSQTAARADYLRLNFPCFTQEHSGNAVSCEDAFDAAISAAVMARHGAHFRRLPCLVGPSRLEGEIWHPYLNG